MRTLGFAVALALVASPALADRKAADACAASLSPQSQAIYSAAVDKVRPGADNKDMVRQITENMVSSGELSMFSAKQTAQAAGACLKKLTN
jgi:hypothetical protein